MSPICCDNEPGVAVFAAEGAGVADTLGLFRDPVCPINNGTRKHAAIAAIDKMNVVFRLDIYLGCVNSRTASLFARH
jgi:hypothetical protein